MMEKSMNAVRLVNIGQPLEIQAIPLPQVGERDVLLHVRAAGICHSDEHYRVGTSSVGPLAQTLGHEIAGVIEEVGPAVHGFAVGDRVAVHYQLSCGDCHYCRRGSEQFCRQGAMIGKHQDGGYAEYFGVPARHLVPLPDEISFEQGAVMMCSTSTSYHALRKARLAPGETVAIFGVGGLGISAVQLATVLGAREVYAVDINVEKLKLAERFRAVPVNASESDPVEQLRDLTDGRGVDVSLELIGLPLTMQQAVRCLAVFGRAALAGISDRPLEVNSYTELLGREAEIIGCSDHLMQEFPVLMELAQKGHLQLDDLIETVPLDADAINNVLESLREFRGQIRTVIIP